MYKTIKGVLRGNRIILEEIIPFSKEQSVLLTILDKPSVGEKELILKGIQQGLDDKDKNKVLTFEESFELLEKLIEV